MPKELTPKQEKFSEELADGKNYSEAYRNSYDTGNMKPETINRNACILAQNSKIKARVAELRAKIEEKLIYTAQQSFKKLEEIQNLALQQKKKIYIKDVSIPIEEESPDLQNAIKAEELKGKLANLYTEKSKIDIKGDVKFEIIRAK